MTVFLIIAAIIVVMGVAMLVPPLLRPHEKVEEDLNARNVAIAKERLSELEAEKTAGSLSEEQFEQAKAELEGNLIEDLRDKEEGDVDRSPSKEALIGVLVFVPLVAGLLYSKMGVPDLAGMSVAEANQQPERTSPHGKGKSQLSMEEMLVKLEKKLEEDPKNSEGWFVLGRSYMSMKNYDKAAWALQKAHELVGDHPTVMVGLADALAMKGGGKVTGRSENLLRKVLAIDPKETTALWLMGIAMEEQERYKEAIGYWQKVLKYSEGKQPEAMGQLTRMIARAKERGGLTDTDIQQTAQTQTEAPTATPTQQPAAAKAEITVTVDIDDAVKAQASADDILFVLAKAVSGPPMPLAVAKLQVSDLPAEVKLNDGMAMMPQMKMSNFPKVKVQARIAKSGKPIAQSGDLESDAVEAETAAATNVKLVINRQVP